jgi:nucleoid-associated protein YgaU
MGDALELGRAAARDQRVATRIDDAVKARALAAERDCHRLVEQGDTLWGKETRSVL